MRQVCVEDGEVGCEHGRGNFVAIGAIASEGADEARAVGWLEMELEEGSRSMSARTYE